MGDLQTKPKHLMSDVERVQDFQRKLYQKAKQEKNFRFYVLYDKVRLRHFLRRAYKLCKANGGVSGVDGITFTDIENAGVEDFISNIIIELEDKTYKPEAVLRVEIPKANGKMRPLGIPTIKDRVIQMVTKLVIEPIFEADFEESSYGFRPKRSGKEAVTEIKNNLKSGKCDVFDADLSAYFDTIPHKELMSLVAKRISDKNILHLIKMWLKAPVMINGRPTGGKKSKVGTPQGGVISPLLANIFLDVLDKEVNRGETAWQKYGVKIIRYADDFVLMAKKIPEICHSRLNWLLEYMKLSLNEEKSKMINAYKKSFDFLGFTFRYSNSIYGDNSKYWNVEASTKSQKKIRSNIREYLRKNGHKSPERLVKALNPKIRGWLNYFTIRGVSFPSRAKVKLEYYLNEKLWRYYNRKSQRRCKLYNQGAFKVLVQYYGLINPVKFA